MIDDLKLKTILEMEQIPLDDLREDADSPSAIHQDAFIITSNFMDFMKYIENDAKAGFRNGKWYPHKSYEGGFETIAWGHKIKSRSELKKYMNGISEAEADQLLKNDILEAHEKLKRYMSSLPVQIQLDHRQTEMLVEFIFNLGSLKQFPKFTRAVLDKDWERAKKESIRHAGGKPLKRRNDSFIKRYF